MIRSLRLFVPVFLLALAAALPARAELSARDKADVARVQAYVNSITTMKAGFMQRGPNGGVARGTFYLSRPNRLRIEFKPPVQMLIVATPVWLIVYDKELQEPQYLPLNSTPAGMLTKKKIDLSGGEFSVLKVSRENRWLEMTVIQTKDPSKGRMTLRFDTEPELKLIGWTVVDGQGLPTAVSLDNVQTGLDLPKRLFQFVSPKIDNQYNR